MAGSLLTPAAVSPLGSALGGGGLMGAYNLAMYDPRALAAMQQAQLGQSMIGEGLSSQSAYPAQAVSRLGQALIGALMLKKGYGTLGQLGSSQDGQTAAELDAISKLGGGALQPPPAATPVQPQSNAAQPMPSVQTFAGEGHPTATNATLQPIIVDAAKRNGIPLQLANAYLQQESGMGTDPRAGTNVGQVTVATAMHPGFGMTPLSGEDWKDPAKNIDFSMQYLRHRGDAAGITDWNDPSQWGLALRGYNGTGDPNYVQHVARYLPQGTSVSDPGVSQPVRVAQAGNVATDVIPPVGVPGGVSQTTGAPQQQAAGGPTASPQVGMANPDVASTVQSIQLLNNIIAGHPFPLDPVRLHAQAALENLKQRLQIGNFQTGPNGIQTNTVTGQQSSAAAPRAHYVEDPNHPGVYIDTTGVNPPHFAPAGNIRFNPFTGEGYVSQPGGTAAPFGAPNMSLAAGLKSAQSQGTETGKQAAVTANKMFDLGREADTAIGNIDYGLNALHQAAQGGQPSGYFAPWEATAAAAAKSLGINTEALGIKPSAVGDIQTAQKTLGVVAGAILQNTIGKDSQITDAKIEHFIHTQPDIAMDPNALDRILNWARSQFVYNREMAMDAIKNTDRTTGMLPPGWRADYVTRKGAFAPIYDPLSQEMAQPSGAGPPEHSAANVPTQQVPQQQPQQTAQPSRADVEAEMRRRGLIK